jgi:hypothetical protein
MATSVHIPLEELSSETRALLERANDTGDVFIDGTGERYRISRLPTPGRTAAESLELLRNSPHANVEVDEDWAKDMRDIIALRHSEPYRDPWE